MKIIFGTKKPNPYEDKREEIRAAIDAEITSVDWPGEMDFDALRTKYGKTKKDWPQGFIHQAARDMGLEVEQ